MQRGCPHRGFVPTDVRNFYGTRRPSTPPPCPRRTKAAATASAAPTSGPATYTQVAGEVPTDQIGPEGACWVSWMWADLTSGEPHRSPALGCGRAPSSNPGDGAAVV